MTREEIVSGLASIFKDVAGVKVPPNVSDDKTIAGDLDIDSLSMVECIVAAEEKFDIAITDSDASRIKTVGDAANLIEALVADKFVKLDNDLVDPEGRAADIGG